MASLHAAGFVNASPIQEMTLEPILNGVDIFAQAETGSGKTGAFAIPILEQILRDDKEGSIGAHESRYAVLSPTRELAQQTHKVFQMFGKELGISSCCIVGGESMDKQKELIGKGVHVLIATPGRFVDLIKQKVVGLDHCKAVVFDEADRLFDMGFQKDIEFILNRAPKHRQLIMTSATNNQEVLRTAYKFHSDPTELKLNADSLLVDHINHKIAMVSEDEKFPLLVSTLRAKEDVYAIVFCNTQVQTHLVAEWLILMNFKAKAISGKLAQNKRTKLMDDFRSKKVTILVCTDVASRGLDIKDVNLVINYDLPQEAANYVHRIGRTGRAGATGEALSFCAYKDSEYLDPISELIEAKIEKIDLDDSDFATDIAPRPYVDRKTMKVVESRPKRKPSETKKPMNTEKVHVKNTREPRPNKREERPMQKASSKPREDKRFYHVESFDIKSVQKDALTYLRVEDESLLGHEIVSTGGRKFLIFGPKKKKIKFFVKPIFKKLLLPFLIELVKRADLNLFVKVSFKQNNLWVSFSGDDEALLSANRFELLQSFEHIATTYLQSRVALDRNLNIEFKCPGSKAKSKPKSKKKDDGKHLIKLVESLRSEILETKEAKKLKPMNSHERRLIHQHLSKDKQLQSNSIGDGRWKQVEISLKN